MNNQMSISREDYLRLRNQITDNLNAMDDRLTYYLDDVTDETELMEDLRELKKERIELFAQLCAAEETLEEDVITDWYHQWTIETYQRKITGMLGHLGNILSPSMLVDSMNEVRKMDGRDQ